MNKKLIALFLLLVLVGGFSLTVAGCNTVEGAGKDVEALGKETQDAAR